MNTEKKLEGKIAVITGAGKGIGREAALAVAAEGATVVAVARTQTDLDKTVELIQEAGGTAISLSRDLTDAVQVQSMVDTVVRNTVGSDYQNQSENSLLVHQ